MQQLKFNYYEDFVDEAVYKLDTINAVNHGGDGISIIAKYEEATEIIKELIFQGFDIGSIVSLNPYDVDNYDDEYVISFADIKYDSLIYCEPMKKNEKYLDVNEDVIYILGNCSSRVIEHCDADEVFEVDIFDEEDDAFYDNETTEEAFESQDNDVKSFNNESKNKNKDKEKISNNKTAKKNSINDDEFLFLISKYDTLADTTRQLIDFMLDWALW